jgi:hypothetical protein
LLISFWLACGVAGFVMLSRFNRGILGSALGAGLGPIGLVIAYFIRDNAKLDTEAERSLPGYRNPTAVEDRAAQPPLLSESARSRGGVQQFLAVYRRIIESNRTLEEKVAGLEALCADPYWAGLRDVLGHDLRTAAQGTIVHRRRDDPS